jgi:hypothetical protein
VGIWTAPNRRWKATDAMLTGEVWPAAHRPADDRGDPVAIAWLERAKLEAAGKGGATACV